MHKFSKTFYIRVIIVTVVMLLLMAFSTLSKGNADIITNATNIIVQPVQKCLSYIYNKTEGVIDYIVNAGDYAKENDILKARVSRLEEENISISEYKAENQRLLELLGMKQSETELTLQGASVITIESDNWYNIISIDKGSLAGVEVNDVVVTAQGLVGTVYEVGSTWAKVREITDVESSISAVCADKGYRGILEGDYSLAPYGRCKLNYVPKDSNIVVGDKIKISDTGSVYPQGVYIGKVIEIYDDEDGLSLSAVIQSDVEFNSLSEILVGH